MYMSLCTIIIVSLQPIQVLSVCSYVENNCERSELSGLFNGTDFLYIYIYIFQAVRMSCRKCSKCFYVYLNIRPV